MGAGAGVCNPLLPCFYWYYLKPGDSVKKPIRTQAPPSFSYYRLEVGRKAAGANLARVAVISCINPVSVTSRQVRGDRRPENARHRTTWHVCFVVAV